MLIKLEAHQARWSADFTVIAGLLDEVFGELATRIDHIGSTSVVGLVAKPVIDIQVTVSSLSGVEAVAETLGCRGFNHRIDIEADRPPAWELQSASEWRKHYFKYADGANVRAQVHVREAGRKNQRYALLFRDYLRSNDRPRDAYGAFKLKLAELVGHVSHPSGTGPYLDLKDPMFDLIADSAEKWASETGWRLD